MIAAIFERPKIKLGEVMSNIPEWVQAALAGAVFLGAAVGVYTTQQIQVASMEQRITVLEQEQRQANQQTMIVLDKLAGSVDKLSISVARLEERLKVVEKQN